jgi:uncharacterized protein YprB with RNaseH-like and TPR domain
MEALLSNLLFLDIETVSLTKRFEQLEPRLQEAWGKKALQLNPECSSIGDYFFEKAAIYAEFGKVIVIGIGYFHENAKGELCFRAKSIAHDSEKEVLSGFSELLQRSFASPELTLCAHNGKEFDFPYLCRRLLVNGLPLPSCLQMSGKKPWEIRHLDTLELWKFGDRKHFTSLELLATIFGIPSSKQTIDGSMVNKAYYIDENLNQIAEYCKRDVLVLAQLFLKMHGLALPKAENMVVLD